MATHPVTSEITGTVCQVLVNVGDVVTEDQPLMLVESMKMEIPIVAPRGGRVAHIHVAQGELISEGEPAATLDA